MEKKRIPQAQPKGIRKFKSEYTAELRGKGTAHVIRLDRQVVDNDYMDYVGHVVKIDGKKQRIIGVEIRGNDRIKDIGERLVVLADSNTNKKSKYYFTDQMEAERIFRHGLPKV